MTPEPILKATLPAPDDKPRLVVVGASAGGIEALSRLLPLLPADFPCVVLIVIHLPSDRNSTLVELFAPKCRLKIKEAEDKETIQAGTAYFAPPNYHLLVESAGELSLSSDEPVHYSRPSIDVLFESAADAFGDAVVGVILTGANSDGAAGVRSICEAGGTVLVQDPKTAEAPAMPGAAIAACSSAQKMNLQEITAHLQRLAAQQVTS